MIRLFEFQCPCVYLSIQEQSRTEQNRTEAEFRVGKVNMNKFLAPFRTLFVYGPFCHGAIKLVCIVYNMFALNIASIYIRNYQLIFS